MRFSVAGLIVMGVALVLVWLPQYQTLAWPVLLVGIGVSVVGTYYANRWIRPPLAEPTLAETLDKLPSRYVLFNHTAMVPHLLLTPRGLIAIKPKRYEGPVHYDANKGSWRGKFSLRRFYGTGMTAEGLGDPAAEVAQLVAQVEGWLQSHLPEIASEVPVQGIALFLPDKTELPVAESPLTLAKRDSLRDLVQELFGRGKPLNRHIYKQLLDGLEATVPAEIREAA